MNKQNPAYDVLSELNDHYSKTQDPHTALKIISLVEYALKYELEPHCRMKPEPEKGFLESIFGFKFGKKSIDESEIHDPFHYYRILAKERNERSKTHYAKNLNARFGVDATLKGNDWTRVADVDNRAQEIYESFFGALPMLARNISVFRHAFDCLLSNESICIDDKAYHDIDRMKFAVDGVATTIKGMIFPYVGEYQRLDGSGYIDFFLSNDEEKKEQKRADELCLMSETIVNDDTLAILRAIADERKRQISAEGYTTEHDDEHTDGSIANAAAHYICADDNINLWTWDKNFDKKEKHSRDKQLLIGSTMTVAEMERRDRVRKMFDTIKANSTEIPLPLVGDGGKVEGPFVIRQDNIDGSES